MNDYFARVRAGDIFGSFSRTRYGYISYETMTLLDKAFLSCETSNLDNLNWPPTTCYMTPLDFLSSFFLNKIFISPNS